MITTRSARGFTLIEVLASLLILAVGLGAVVALVFSAKRVSTAAADRNVVKAILKEAVADIERCHLITADMKFKASAPRISPARQHVGLFIETVKAADSTNVPNEPTDPPPFVDCIPTIHNSQYQWAEVYTSDFKARLDIYKGCLCLNPPGPPEHTMMWPLSPADVKSAGGPLQKTGIRPEEDWGMAYRVIYRLERHWDWHPRAADLSYYFAGAEDDTSPFAGVYVLTLTVYRDPGRNGARLEQVSDPMVVYLSDKKVR